MFGIFKVLSVCMTLTQARRVDPTTSNVPQRTIYGVIFQEQADLMLAQEYWLHTFHVPLSIRFSIKKVPFCSIENTQQVNTSNHSKLNTTNKIVGNNSQSCALLPFVGSLFKSIFGTPTMDDVNILAGHINTLNRRTENTAKAL